MTTIIPRETYDHPGPLGPALDLSRVTGWDFHHTAGSLEESPHSVADSTRRRWGRSSYNFLISQHHGHGDVWEMQGLQRGAHNDGENSTRLGVVFVGYYHPSINHHPSEQMLAAAAWLMAHGHEQWGIPIHAKGHRDTDSTACPGDHLYELIPHIVRRTKEDDMTPEQANQLDEVHRVLLTQVRPAIGRVDQQRAAISEAIGKIDDLAAASGADATALANEVRRVLSHALAD